MGMPPFGDWKHGALLGHIFLYLDSLTLMKSPNLSSSKPTPDGNQHERLGYSSRNGSRKPQRITITVSHSVHQALLEESYVQGRSLSNLASFWLEQQAEATRGLRSNGNYSPSS